MCSYIYSSSNSLISYKLIYSNSSRPIKNGRPYGVSSEMLVGGKTRGCKVANVFRRREDAETFIAMLAENGVEPCHIKDILADFVTG